METKLTTATFQDEQYFVLTDLDELGRNTVRQVAPVSFFQIKSEVARLSLYIEDLIAKEIAAIVELEAGLAHIKREVNELKQHMTEIAVRETGSVLENIDGKLEDLGSRLITRQDALNARTAKLAGDLQLFETVLEGKIEGVKGVVASSGGDIAKAIQETITTNQASLQADISSELTDLGRLILKKVKETIESGGTQGASPTIQDKELGRRLEVLESLIREKKSFDESTILKEILEKLKTFEESKAGRADGRAEPDKAEIRELLAIMDSFDRLLKFLGTKGVVIEESVLAGLYGINALIERYIVRYELEKMPVAGKFDPHVHRAMAVVEVPEKEDNDIVEVLLSGYLYKGRVFRSAEVIVNRHKS